MNSCLQVWHDKGYKHSTMKLAKQGTFNTISNVSHCFTYCLCQEMGNQYLSNDNNLRAYITIPNSFASKLIHYRPFAPKILITQCQKAVYNKSYNKGNENKE